MIEYWPLIAYAITSTLGAVVWAIRLEGRLNNERDARMKLDADTESRFTKLYMDLRSFYSTKEEVVRLEGLIGSVANQLPDIKALLVRVEGKVDSFLIAALKNHNDKG